MNLNTWSKISAWCLCILMWSLCLSFDPCWATVLLATHDEGFYCPLWLNQHLCMLSTLSSSPSTTSISCVKCHRSQSVAQRGGRCWVISLADALGEISSFPPVQGLLLMMTCSPAAVVPSTLAKISILRNIGLMGSIQLPGPTLHPPLPTLPPAFYCSSAAQMTLSKLSDAASNIHCLHTCRQTEKRRISFVSLIFLSLKESFKSVLCETVETT